MTRPLRITYPGVIYHKGAGLAALWPECLALLGMGVAILWFASTRFRKRIG